MHVQCIGLFIAQTNRILGSVLKKHFRGSCCLKYTNACVFVFNGVHKYAQTNYGHAALQVVRELRKASSTTFICKQTRVLARIPPPRRSPRCLGRGSRCGPCSMDSFPSFSFDTPSLLLSFPLTPLNMVLILVPSSLRSLRSLLRAHAQAASGMG